MSNSSIWPIDRTLSVTTTPGQCESVSNGNEGVVHIPQSFSITEASPSYCLMSYPGHSLQRCSQWAFFYFSLYIYIYIYIYIYAIVSFTSKRAMKDGLCEQHFSGNNTIIAAVKKCDTFVGAGVYECSYRN